MVEPRPLTLQAFVKRSSVPGRWTAVCVDRYMVAEGDSPDEAMLALDRVAKTEREFGTDDDPLGHLPKAPHKYRVAYEEAMPIETWRAEDHTDLVKPDRPDRPSTMEPPQALFEQRVLAAASV